jgi:hypothetical protein
MNDVLPFNVSDIVYKKISDEPGQIIGVIYRGQSPNQIMLYQVTWQGDHTDDHYPFELQRERPGYDMAKIDKD